jgi:hypothetical protein
MFENTLKKKIINLINAKKYDSIFSHNIWHTSQKYWKIYGPLRVINNFLFELLLLKNFIIYVFKNNKISKKKQKKSMGLDFCRCNEKRV